MSLLEQVSKQVTGGGSQNKTKNNLTNGLVSGEISHRFEVIREHTSSTGRRKIIGNIGSTIFFLPWIFCGLVFIGTSFWTIFSPDSETPWAFCLMFPAGLIGASIGFSGVKGSIGEMIQPEDYVKYEVTVYFNRRERYLAEVKVILDATNDDIIGDIKFLKEISLSKKSEIVCRYRPGSDGAVRPDFNDFIISHGYVSIIVDGHTYLKDKKRIAIAKEWSEKLGVKVATPLVK
jgi:hypothetical protein